MLEYVSSIEDLKRILEQLKEKIQGAEIQDTKLEDGNILDGYVESKKSTTHFQIKYNRENFLRLSVDGGMYQEKLEALRCLGNAISQIDDDGVIGMPIAFYNIYDVNNTNPHLEWAFSHHDKYVSDLKNDTLFDDVDINNLVLLKDNNVSLDQKMKTIGSLMAIKCCVKR